MAQRMSSESQKPAVGIIASDTGAAALCAHIIERSGGRPKAIVSRDDVPADDPLSALGALVIAGSPDVQSLVSGDAQACPGERDSRGSLEQALLAAALEADLPTLCVGRGMHALNFALGGTPAQDVPGHGSHLDVGEHVSAYHRMYISPGSKLAAIVGSGGFVRVNSRHRQGLREAQKSRLLMASAYSLDDGIIEALESPDHRWVVGVQFQPERRGELPPHFDRLFQSLVDRAVERTNAAISG